MNTGRIEKSLTETITSQLLKTKKGPANAGPLLNLISIDYFKVAGQGLPALDLTFTIMKSP